MLLDIQQITKSFGNKEILHGVSFQVKSGRAMGFLGRNGAGKSTTIRCLMDVFRPTGGQFLLDGAPFRPADWRIGYLPEERGMYAKATIQSQLIYFAMLRGAGKKAARQTADEWISVFELSEYAKKPLEILSKGNQQKIQIAQAFLNDPDILILDEPFSGLDPVNSAIFKDAIRSFVKKGKLVIFSSHQMGYVEEMCDDITLIDQGNILMTGALSDIKAARGDGKFTLRMKNMDAAALSARLQSAFPGLPLEVMRNDVLFVPNGEHTAERIMASLAADANAVHHFGLYEPTLNDIFVSTLGGKA